MKAMISRLRKGNLLRIILLQLRYTVASSLVVLTFFVSTSFDISGNQLQAQAEPVTPEATEYKVDTTANQLRNDAENVKQDAKNAATDLASDTKQAAKNAKENTQDIGNNLIENVREKLNLDEPIDPGTKQAFKQIKGTASGAVNTPRRAVKHAAEKVRAD